MELDENEILEFKTEAEELLQDPENHLLQMEQEANFSVNYSAVFRAFHSLKGAAGMLGLEELREHMHKLETSFHEFENSSSLSQELATFFLRGVDAARAGLRQEKIEFKYEYSTKEKIDAKSSEVLNKPEKIIIDLKAKPPLIYMIDDDKENLEILSAMIRPHGYRIECFTLAETAMGECEESRPDLILCDMKMPGMSGMDVLRRVTEIDSEIPFIFISAFLDKATLVEALNLGAFAVMDKPIKEIQAIGFITQALKRREMWHLLNRSIDLILFQITDIEQYLISQNKLNLVEIMKQDARQLLEARRALKTLK